jgi:hypothetical protein
MHRVIDLGFCPNFFIYISVISWLKKFGAYSEWLCIIISVVFVGVLTQKSDIVEGRLFQVMRYVGLGEFSD